MTPEQIQKALKKRKITQKKIATDLGLSEMSVSRCIKYFHLRIGISDKIMTAVADAIGKPKEQVFSDYYKGPRLRSTSKSLGKCAYKNKR